MYASLQARPLLADNNYPDLIDERVVDPHDVHIIQLYLIVNLAEDCLKKDPAERYTMGQVSFDKPISTKGYLKMNSVC